MEPPSWGRRKAEKPLFRLMHFDGLAQSALDTLFFNERSLPAAARLRIPGSRLLPGGLGVLMYSVRQPHMGSLVTLLAEEVDFNQGHPGRLVTPAYDGGVVSGRERGDNGGFTVLRECDRRT